MRICAPPPGRGGPGWFQHPQLTPRHESDISRTSIRCYIHPPLRLTCAGQVPPPRPVARGPARTRERRHACRGARPCRWRTGEWIITMYKYINSQPSVAAPLAPLAASVSSLAVRVRGFAHGNILARCERRANIPVSPFDQSASVPVHICNFSPPTHSLSHLHSPLPTTPLAPSPFTFQRLTCAIVD